MARTLAGLLYLTVALDWCIATASAYSVSVVGPTTSSVSPSDVIEFDVILNTDGDTIYAYIMRVFFIASALSPDEFASERHPILDPEFYPFWYSYGSFQLHPGYWYISEALPAPMPSSGSIATLVFHVMDVPESTITSVLPVVDLLLDGNLVDVSPQVNQSGAYVHVVPEPMSPLLLASGVGLLLLLGLLRRPNGAV